MSREPQFRLEDFQYNHQLGEQNLTSEMFSDKQKDDILQKALKGSGKFPLFEQASKENYAYKALGTIQQITPFSRAFFSHKNIQEIQRLIRYKVYVYSDKKYIIDNQDETELVIVMRSQYLSYARVQSEPKFFAQEIERLNELVLKAILPNLLSNIEQYVGYIRDSTENYNPVARPVALSTKGENSLRSISDVLVGDDLFFQKSS